MKNGCFPGELAGWRRGPFLRIRKYNFQKKSLLPDGKSDFFCAGLPPAYKMQLFNFDYLFCQVPATYSYLWFAGFTNCITTDNHYFLFSRYY